MSLILLSLLTPVTPVYAQSQLTATPTRDIVTEQIKGYASRHVKSGSPMQTQLVVDLYHNNTVGLSPNETAQIYEEHYIRLKSTPEPGFWSRVIPNAGWVLAIILALLLVFRDVVKEWMLRFFRAVGNRIYNQISGNRLFYFISLRRYKRNLLRKYEELHIPFRPNRPLMMREVYVPLRVADSLINKQFDAYSAVTHHKRLMIKGPPGSGKSMLIKHLALSYAYGRLDYLPYQPMPIIIELHRLNDSDVILEQYLVDELARNGFPHAERFVGRNLERGVLMLLFDGLDEVNASHRARAVQQIRDFLDRYRNCRFVCTCRTAIYHGEFSAAVDQTLEVVEFEDQQIRRFLRSWEPSMPEGKSIEQLLQTLSDRPRIMALARNPLLLTIIAYLYTDTNFVLPQSRAEFYEKSTDLLLDQWHQERNQFKGREKRLVLQQLALSIQDSAVRGGQDRRTMAFQLVLHHVRQTLPDLSLSPDDAIPLLDEIVERSGLLLSIDGGTRYSFAHLTLQEFFAAGRLRDNGSEMINRFKADHDTWRETIKLWCGLAIDATHLIQDIYAEDPITAFECLADAQKVDQELAGNIVEEFKRHLGTTKNETEIVQAFGSVASDVRPRGVAVFEFLEETLKTPEPNRRVAAANALSRTNLPQAAYVLAEHCKKRPELRAPLVRMGDLAVPALLSQARQLKSAETLDGLHTISTPHSARALTALLWDLDTKLATGAAWRLAALLVHSDIEDALRDYPINIEQRRAARIDWVWQPFSEPEGSSLPIIAGRAAYLIDQGEVPNIALILAPQIAIPLCAMTAEREFKVSALWGTENEINSDEVQRDLEFLGLSNDKLRSQSLAVRKGEIRKAVNEYGLRSTESELAQFCNMIIDATSSNQHWQYVMNCLKPDKRYDLLRRMIEGPMPSRTDWVNIFTPVKYEFRRGWHFQAILILFAVISIISTVEMVTMLSGYVKPWWEVWILVSFIVIILCWVALLLFRFRVPQPFGHEAIESVLISLLFGPIVPVIVPAWIVIDRVRSNPESVFRKSSVSWMLVGSVLMGIISALGLISFVAMAYFLNLAILRNYPWQYALLFWSIFLVSCVGLWLIGRHRHRAAQNPLSNILKPVAYSSLAVHPKSRIRYIRWILRLR